MIKLLEFKDININKSNKYRLKNISLSIHEGDKIALIGKSGAGKSTLISAANGTICPNHGLITWKGIPLKNRTRRDAREIGTLWQELRLIEELNVAQNINSGALGRHNLFWALKNILGQVDKKSSIATMKAIGLDTEILNRTVREISGGQKQRVAIARLLRQESELMLADEPFSNLDPKLSNKILNMFIKGENNYTIPIPKTVLISLHRPELLQHFTRVIGLKNGELVLDISTRGLSPSKVSWIY